MFTFQQNFSFLTSSSRSLLSDFLCNTLFVKSSVNYSPIQFRGLESLKKVGLTFSIKKSIRLQKGNFNFELRKLKGV